MTPERPVIIRLILVAHRTANDVVVMTGWAMFESSDDIDLVAVVRITTPDGKLIDRHIIASEKPPAG